jgi:hypothetical protein
MTRLISFIYYNTLGENPGCVAFLIGFYLSLDMPSSSYLSFYGFGHKNVWCGLSYIIYLQRSLILEDVTYDESNVNQCSNHIVGIVGSLTSVTVISSGD